MNGLSLEFESVDLEHLVPGVELATPLGCPALDHTPYHHTLALVANGSTLEWKQNGGYR